MDNIYFEVAFLLFKNVLLNDSNYDMIGHICTVAIVVLFFMCIFIAGYAIFFPLLNNKKIYQKRFSPSKFGNYNGYYWYSIKFI